MASSDWWANKLGGKTSSSSPTPATGPAPNMPYLPPQQQQPNVPVTYDPNNDQLVSKARTSRMNDRCPECNSGNYFAPQGTQRMRCYDCGYPITQSGSGSISTGSSSSGPTQAAKQVGQSGGFNPNTIVDRIG